MLTPQEQQALDAKVQRKIDNWRKDDKSEQVIELRLGNLALKALASSPYQLALIKARNKISSQPGFKPYRP